MKVLMVCLGNICRSPLAEGILKSKVVAEGLDWEVESAGTSGFHSGEKSDKRSVKEAKKHNVDISQQRSRQFRGWDLESFDLIYAMDSMNYTDILTHAKTDEERAKVKLIMNELEADRNIQVPDPYYGEYGFENVYEMLDKACNEIIKNYR